ncbi:uncharacterized protein LOC122659209 [Telopea speciosissima]|uniref:uncharacterized protein LOC122659209 n=1 Tax=Telopea speciosissima TaxID=54955 RepID=UPI001CC80837|nr:uncharacterized protein LOC122659209 [Telopea speciosissima]
MWKRALGTPPSAGNQPDGQVRRRGRKIASGLRPTEDCLERTIIIQKQLASSVLDMDQVEVNQVEDTQPDWRTPIVQYLKNPHPSMDRRTKYRALRYVLVGELFKKGKDDLLLKCVSLNESMVVMAEVHEGICGSHQASPQMRWLIRRHGYHWPTILADCIKYAKGFQACQRHGPVQHAPAMGLSPIVKLWPFRGWAMDLMGKVTPPATRGHCFIIVATDYFTKWAEAVPMKLVSQTEVIRFLKTQIVHRFGLPETITCDNGSVFTSDQVLEFATDYGITITHSTPYYAQGNGQAEASNKVLKNCLAKVVDEDPRRWAELLSEVLWAFRTSQWTSTGTTPFSLTYGHDQVLPMEISVRFARVAYQQGMTPVAYSEAMLTKLEDLDEERFMALDRILAQKARVAVLYNQRVVPKSFQEGEMVLKAILPIGTKDPVYGKWSPTWEGPFIGHQVLKGGAYRLKEVEGDIHLKPINGKSLKMFYPTMWDLG